MKWNKYTIHTTTEAEDLVSAMLCELGVEGVQIEDNVPLSEQDTKGMFIDILPELPADDGRSRVSFYLRVDASGDRSARIALETPLPQDQAVTPQSAAMEAQAARADSGTDGAASDGTAAPSDTATVDASYTIADRVYTPDEAEALLSQVRDGLAELAAYAQIGAGTITVTQTEDRDWMTAWKAYFHPFRVGSFLVKPSWEEIPEAYVQEVRDGSLRVLAMDPGAAFGTGTHETTRLCLSALQEYVRGGEQVLDIGTGSGILGIGALLLGAAKVTATDLDEACVEAVSGNLAQNGIPEENFRLLIGNVLGDQAMEDSVGYGAYDLMLANILAPVIVSLAAAGAADRFLKPGGFFITSGIIDEKEAAVTRAFSENPAWEILKVSRDGEWVSVIARKR